MNTAPMNGANVNSPTPLAYTPPPVPATLPVRDRPILRLIRDALMASKEFDAVTTSGLPEMDGQSAGIARLGSLELQSSKEVVLFSDPYNVTVERTVHFLLTVSDRDNDPDARDDEADRLVAVAANAINGNDFGGVTIVDRTFLSAGTHLPPMGVERRIKAAGQFVYLIPSWNTRNTTP